MSRQNTIYKKQNLLYKAASFTEKIFIKEKLNNWAGYIIFFSFATFLGFLMAFYPVIGIGLTGGICALAIALVCLFNTELALYINIIYAFFIAHFNRLLFNNNLQEGVFSDILIGLSFLSLFIKKADMKKKLNELTKAPLVVTLLILYGYMAIELFNPYARFFVGWFPAFRKIISLVLILFVSYNVFETKAIIFRFFKVLFVLCVIVGLYSCVQQWHGFFNFEIEWLMADPKRYRMTFLSGGTKRMSTMPDALSVSIIMSTCGVFYIAIANEIKSLKYRIIILTGLVFIILSMSYSVTRTANAMIAAGIFMYLLLTLQKKSTQRLAIVSVFTFIVLLYGPFYNSPQIRAFKQTFQGSKDASFNVREANRKSIQPYIHHHPIGGGLGTTGDEGKKYNPGHPLAGFPPDSGYLRKALEIGWIGFGIICFLYFLVLKTGIHGYFSSPSYESRMIYAASTAACFSFYVGDFSQVAIGQITDVFVYYPLLAIMIRLKYIDLNEIKI